MSALPEQSRPRVLHVLPALGKEGQIGGAERIAVQLVTLLQERGLMDVRLCVLGTRDPHYPSYGLRDEPLFLEKPNFHLSITAFAQAVRRLKHVLHQWRPAIVHSHLWPADLVVAAALNPRTARHIVHLHDARGVLRTARKRGRSFRTLFYRWFMQRSAARFIACSKATGDLIVRHLGFEPARIEVIRNAISADWLCDPAAPPVSAKSSLVVGYAARLQPMKAQDVLIEAMAKVIEKHPEARLRLAGDGSQREAYQQKARVLGIADRVEFLGRVREMRAFYDDLDVYALPSLQEGLPVSILEAMARKKPVVATSVDGVPEVICHGVEGLLVPPSDPKALADALVQLAGNPALRAQMAEAGYVRVRKEFLMDRMIEQLHRYYFASGSES